MNLNYDDIVELERPKSIYQKMPLLKRASQFASFAALEGHMGVMIETSRKTEKMIELDEYEKEEINRKLQWLLHHENKELIVMIKYFRRDLYKCGGKYIEYTGKIRCIDEFYKTLTLDDDRIIEVDTIISLEI